MVDLCPKVPKQDNSSDCGVYLLQYVESFFKVCKGINVFYSQIPAYNYKLLGKQRSRKILQEIKKEKKGIEPHIHKILQLADMNFKMI